jgi:HK97 family phage major capsid protein
VAGGLLFDESDNIPAAHNDVGNQRQPLLGTLQNMPDFSFMGVPLNIVTQMTDVAPGATPIAYGDWQNACMVVTCRVTTMTVDPSSAFTFEARVGSATTCPNAARPLRIKRVSNQSPLKIQFW